MKRAVSAIGAEEMDVEMGFKEGFGGAEVALIFQILVGDWHEGLPIN
jgi:hypothetical protein